MLIVVETHIFVSVDWYCKRKVFVQCYIGGLRGVYLGLQWI